MRPYLFSVVFLLLQPGEASAAPRTEEACARLGRTQTQVARCTEFAKMYEIEPSFIAACADFSQSDEVRMDCMKSGSSYANLRLCQSMDWNEENTLTCLRYADSPSLARACKAFSADEENQLECLRFGRPTAQVESCQSFGSTEEEKMECLRYEYPVATLRKCRSADDKSLCLQDYVAKVEESYRRQRDEVRRSIASEAEPVYVSDEELKNEPKHPAP